jgi:hypothetical protein
MQIKSMSYINKKDAEKKLSYLKNKINRQLEEVDKRNSVN